MDDLNHYYEAARNKRTKDESGKLIKTGKMRDTYYITDLLGKGAFGEVRKCIYKEDMKDKRSAIKDYRAVKILSKSYMEEKEVLSFKNEISSMKQINHPSIMKMHEFFEDPKRYLLVTEMCRGGDLYEYIHEKGKMDERETAICMKQVISAINYMHTELNIVHRDLKPENILLETPNDLNDLKLIDFGTAQRFDEIGQALYDR